MSVKHPQAILAIDESYLSQTLGAVDGLNSISFDEFFAGADPHLVIRRRQELESNENYLQVTPYAMITRIKSCQIDDLKDLKFATYYRPISGGESRLHGNASIGFGGHIDACDVCFTDNSGIVFKDTVLNTMARELCEELGLSKKVLEQALVIGYRLITDKSNKVGRVHLGMAFIVVLPEEIEFKPEVSEIDYAGEFTVVELLAKQQAGEIEMENWTKLLVDGILNQDTN